MELLFKIDDVSLLKLIRQRLEILRLKKRKDTPAFMESVKPIRNHVSLEELMNEQNYNPITYQQFRKKVDNLEWEESWEELLGVIR